MTHEEESGAILATLIRRLGDFDLAEEALQEAFAAAVQQWPGDGATASDASSSGACAR
jgi:RNA polymerase sigma-70 factor (ECF subfamily)